MSESRAPDTAAVREAVVEAWVAGTGSPEAPENVNFFDAGADSLALVEMHGALSAQLGREIPIATLFQFPTIRSLTAHLAADPREGEAS
ncbi:MAG: acyl carrier protein [Gaiellaceae bacterium]